MLYGSATGITAPGLPVTGSIVVRLLPTSFVTYIRLRFHPGTTCCGRPPPAKCSTIRYVRGSIASTVSLRQFGTETRPLAASAAGDRAVEPAGTQAVPALA